MAKGKKKGTGKSEAPQSIKEKGTIQYSIRMQRGEIEENGDASGREIVKEGEIFDECEALQIMSGVSQKAPGIYFRLIVKPKGKKSYVIASLKRMEAPNGKDLKCKPYRLV